MEMLSKLVYIDSSAHGISLPDQCQMLLSTLNSIDLLLPPYIHLIGSKKFYHLENLSSPIDSVPLDQDQ